MTTSKVINDIAASTLVSSSLGHTEASHHVMKKCRPHYGKAHKERPWGLLPTAMPAGRLGSDPHGPATPSDDSSPAGHLKHGLLRHPGPELPS